MTTLAVVLAFIIIIYINTIYISYWRSLSKTDQEKVIAERSRLVIQKGRGSAISSRETNKVWDILIHWKEGLSSW